MDLDRIVSCAIHPAIGVARVGNSTDQDGWFIGPEAPGFMPDPTGGYKDAQGALKRQVARFRVYGFDAEGNVVRELTADEAEITWTVRLANTKAAWYKFDLAMDLPDVTPAYRQSDRRNRPTAGADRAKLVIDPGKRSITGAGGREVFDSGKFFDCPVPLGEIRTDEDGRLLVFGGFGRSFSPTNAALGSFTDNDWWCDDVSDGPVRATVKIGNCPLQVKPAWVIVAPPNYAPGVRSVVTMYDIVLEAGIKLEESTAGSSSLRPTQISFTKHIFPILESFCRTEWVNKGFYLKFGKGRDHDFLDPNRLARLASNDLAHKLEREAVFSMFREPDLAPNLEDALPHIYGDKMVPGDATHERQWMTVTDLQYSWLRSWADGNFLPGWNPGEPVRPTSLDGVKPEDRPAALDRAALEECTGGPFHPGCEATWPMRIPLLYSEPFRIRERPDGWKDTFPDPLPWDLAISPDGPLYGSVAGDVTKWMAVPWQVDTVSCLSDYDRDRNFLPTFWPARVPNDVFTQTRYDQVRNLRLDPDDRLNAFTSRSNWLRGIPSGPQPVRFQRFVDDWYKVGVVEQRPGPGDEPFPAEMYVEVNRSLPRLAEEDDER